MRNIILVGSLVMNQAGCLVSAQEARDSNAFGAGESARVVDTTVTQIQKIIFPPVYATDPHRDQRANITIETFRSQLAENLSMRIGSGTTFELDSHGGALVIQQPFSGKQSNITGKWRMKLGHGSFSAGLEANW